MAITIERAKPEDARELLDNLKVVGGETDNLSFGSEGLQIPVDEEQRFLLSAAQSDRRIFLIARRDGKIVGQAHYAAFDEERMSHRGEIGISIRKSAWGMGIGSMLMERLLDFARNVAKSEIVSLEVRSDNQRAIRLYEKFGFQKVGCFRGYFKIDGVLIDYDTMEKML